MEAKKESIKKFNNIDDLVNNSINGTSFAYDFYLKLHGVKYILSIYDKNELIAFMPLFEENKSLNQSTMYIPYGGPVILYNFSSYRKQILYTRELLDVISKYLVENYDSISFSMDTSLIDIKSLVNNGLVPEVRYTYLIDLSDSLENIYKRFGSDRKKDIKLSYDVEVLCHDNVDLFDLDKALVWEYNYGEKLSKRFTKKYVKHAILNNKGNIFTA